MRFRSRIHVGLLCGLLALGATSGSEAHASITERIVAVIGERPILLSELRQRARPQLKHIVSTSFDPSQQEIAEARILRELLNRMIDERVLERVAAEAHVSVTAEEVDNGIRRVAAQAKLDPNELIAEANRRGLSEQDYRDEIRRQVLEAKLVQLRVAGRVHVTDEDARVAYAKWRVEIAAADAVNLRILVVPTTTSGGAAATLSAQRALAQQIVIRARGGEDFCQLVARFAPALPPIATCGTRGAVPRAALAPEIAEAVRQLGPGQVAEPVTFRDPMGNEVVLVIQLASEMRVAPFEDVQEQMRERALTEATDRLRKQWLLDQRRNVYVDTRL